MQKVLLIDDEPAQHEALSGLLIDNFPKYIPVAHAYSVDQGIELIKLHKPDLVFMDVLMPPQTGFDLLLKLNDPSLNVIFVTSYEKYAIHAFKVSAVDYILKPVELEDLADAIKKYETKKKGNPHLEYLLQSVRQNTSDKIRVALPTMQGFTFREVGTIIRCESDNTYSTFYFTDKSKLVVSRTLKECEELLGEYNFMRIHKSHLINMAHIKEYLKGEGGQAVMDDGSVVDVSRRKKEEFIERVQGQG